MNLIFFTVDENLYDILSKNIPNINKDFSIISSGWTNIVLDILINNEHFIAKFPRDQFWSDCIEKDAIISNFIGSTFSNFYAPNAKIYYDNNRPFMVYKKIDGNTLTTKFNNLNKEEKNKIAKSLANIFYNFHKIDINTIPDIAKNKFYDFITRIPKLDTKPYDFSLFDEMLYDIDKEKQVFIHGDLNIGNILLDNKQNITAIIDYAFSGICDIYTDLARISCRTSEEFFMTILEEYERISGLKLNMVKIENRKILWKYIEEEYMEFMKIKHPEIKF